MQTLGLLVIPRPITKVIKEDIYCQINIEIKTPFANETNEKKIRQNSKLKCLNKDIFDIFYADCIEFQNYISGILKILLNQ